MKTQKRIKELNQEIKRHIKLGRRMAQKYDLEVSDDGIVITKMGTMRSFTLDEICEITDIDWHFQQAVIARAALRNDWD